MKKWSAGRFVNDWKGKPKRETRLTPENLDRAALEACVGGAFFPGIEASWLLRDSYKFIEPFRLDPAKREAGDVTKQMAVPWQADFTDCTQEDELRPGGRGNAPTTYFRNAAEPRSPGFAGSWRALPIWCPRGIGSGSSSGRARSSSRRSDASQERGESRTHEQRRCSDRRCRSRRRCHCAGIESARRDQRV